MNKELQDYYEERFSMCSSKGWKQLIEDIQLMKPEVESIKGATTLEQLHFKKGELSIINWLLSLEMSSREVYDMLQEEEANRE
jgi:hypothetical protein